MDWLQTAANIAVIISVVWILTFGTQTIHEVVTRHKLSVTPRKVLLASIPVVLIIFPVPLVLPFLTTSQQHNVGSTPTPTLSPTPTPIVTQINQIMSCTNCDTGDNFALSVKYATFDPAQSQVTLVIGVKNISTDDKSEVQFKYLKLQDTQTGVTADGGGDGFSSFAISVNSQILFRPTFQFVPVPGHEYSLSAELDSFDVGWAYHLFSPINIQFR